MASLTVLQPSAYSSATSLSSMGTRNSNSTDGHSIHLLCAIPGQLPRSSQPTPQRLIHVAASLSVHLSTADLPHAFLGRFSLFLRGANVSPRWVDVEVARPIIGGTQRVKDVLALNPEFAIHGEVLEDGVDKLLVSHRCGIYLNLTVGAVPSLKKKTNLISAHANANTPPVVLPCLTPARQFLETVILASSAAAKPEDFQDLVWMKNNLKMDIMADPTTLKKAWEEGRMAKIIKSAPVTKEVFVELGLAVVPGSGSGSVSGDDESVRSTAPTNTLKRAASRYSQ